MKKKEKNTEEHFDLKGELSSFLSSLIIHFESFSTLTEKETDLLSLAYSLQLELMLTRNLKEIK